MHVPAYLYAAMTFLFKRIHEHNRFTVGMFDMFVFSQLDSSIESRSVQEFIPVAWYELYSVISEFCFVSSTVAVYRFSSVFAGSFHFLMWRRNFSSTVFYNFLLSRTSVRALVVRLSFQFSFCQRSSDFLQESRRHLALWSPFGFLRPDKPVRHFAGLKKRWTENM